MDRRTHEGPMDWEYQNSGPFDPTSPFTHAAKANTHSVFGNSPSKMTSRPNLFAATTPSKQQVPRPQSSLFTPQLSSQNAAPAFRNPAFVTLREQAAMSDTSGAEDSPAMTDKSDWPGDTPNDTPDADRMSDVHMTSPVSPTRVDKGTRYNKSNTLTRKHAPGRGEIRNPRDYSVADIARKRKRHNRDKDVSSMVRYQNADDDSDSDEGSSTLNRSRTRRSRKDEQPMGFPSSLFHVLGQYPDAPQHLWSWAALTFALGASLAASYGVLSAIWTVQGDVRRAHEAERARLLSEITECQNQYTLNECSKKDRPALKVICDEWYDCMIQNPESIMKLKNLAKHTGEIINEFLGVLNIRAVVFLILLVAVVVFGARHSAHPAPPPAPSRSASSQQQNWPGEFNGQMPQGGGAGYFLVQTPSRRRHGIADEEDTDTDNSPPKLLLPFTPSSHRSPYKGERERSRSPSKYRRSPSKGFH